MAMIKYTLLVAGCFVGLALQGRTLQAAPQTIAKNATTQATGAGPQNPTSGLEGCRCYTGAQALLNKQKNPETELLEYQGACGPASDTLGVACTSCVHDSRRCLSRSRRFSVRFVSWLGKQ